MIPEQFENEVAQDLAHAREAQSTGNAGKVRTAARRAVGTAIRYWLEKYPHNDHPNDAMQQIRQYASEDNIPPAVTDALLRLQARLTPDFESPSTDPIADAIVIISYIRSELER